MTYGYDDVLILPNYSELKSRSEVDLSTTLGSQTLRLPLIAAPMSTVCEYEMCDALWKLGGIGTLHRYNTPEEQLKQFELLAGDTQVLLAVGTKDWEERLDAILSVYTEDSKISGVVIDTAHGDHKSCAVALLDIKEKYPDMFVMVGNVVTADATKRLVQYGADAIRVGVGGGSHCTTRTETGIGMPQFSAVEECAKVTIENNVMCIADGGIRTPGDALKALAAGADAVMIGGMFAGTDEAPGNVMTLGYGNSIKKVKQCSGMASSDAKSSNNMPDERIEGFSSLTPYKGSVSNVVRRLSEGLQSGISYTGASNIRSFQKSVKYVYVTPSANHITKLGM